MRDGTVLEYAPIPRENDAPVIDGQADDLAIRIIVPIERIETDQSQVVCKFAKMDIEDEARLAQWLGTQAGHGLDIEPLEHRVHSDVLTPGE